MDEQKIKEARSILENYDNIQILKDLFKLEGEYYIEISINSGVKDSKFIPEVSNWYLKFREKDISFYPAKESSFTCTFQHQAINGNEDESGLFYSGKLCLDRAINIFHNDGFDYLPSDYTLMFQWYLERAIKWIDCASKGELVRDKDPFELPVIPGTQKGYILFKENNIKQWGFFDSTYGYIRFKYKEIATIGYYVLYELYDKNMETSRGTIYWGDYFKNAQLINKLGIFIKLEKIPIVKPWMYPKTWSELIECCNQQNINILDLIKKLLIKNRMLCANGILGICFPIPDKIGGDNKLIHWIFIELPNYAYPKHGFRNNLMSKVKYYLTRFKGDLKYYLTENLDGSYILSRGRINMEISNKSIAIIGIGSLGSLFAECISRIGFEDLTLFDGDFFIFSNVARHDLDIRSNGINKAIALQNKIKCNNPNAFIKTNGYLSDENIKNLKGVDIIIDCSANEKVLNLLANEQFQKEKIYVIAAFGYGAKDFIIYMHKGNSFNKEEYDKKTKPIYKSIVDEQNIREKDLILQGIGCYHPVFPARYDDVSIWSNMLIKVIENKISKNIVSSCVHLKMDGIEVKLVDEWEE